MSEQNSGEAPVSQEVQTSDEPSGDMWEAGKEAFESFSPEDAPTTQDTEEKQDVQSQLEQDVKEAILNLDTLKVPHKYKEEILKFVEPELKKHKTEAETAAKKVEEYTTGLREFVTLFQDIAKNPDKVGWYVSNYGQLLNLPPEIIQKYQSPPAKKEDREQPVNQENQAQQVTQDDLLKATQLMIAAKTEPELMHWMGVRDQIAQALYEQTTFKKIGGFMKEYHEKFVSPTSKKLEEMQRLEDERQAEVFYDHSVRGWDDALAQTKTAFEALNVKLDEYVPEIKKLLKEDPEFNTLRQYLNQDPNDYEGKKRLVHRVAEFLVNKKKIAELSQPKPTFGGLKPSSKFTHTKRATGSSWEENVENARREIYPEHPDNK